jgi:hypothetical protein
MQGTLFRLRAEAVAVAAGSLVDNEVEIHCGDFSLTHTERLLRCIRNLSNCYHRGSGGCIIV